MTPDLILHLLSMMTFADYLVIGWVLTAAGFVAEITYDSELKDRSLMRKIVVYCLVLILWPTVVLSWMYEVVKGVCK